VGRGVLFGFEEEVEAGGVFAEEGVEFGAGVVAGGDEVGCDGGARHQWCFEEASMMGESLNGLNPRLGCRISLRSICTDRKETPPHLSVPRGRGLVGVLF